MGTRSRWQDVSSVFNEQHLAAARERHKKLCKLLFTLSFRALGVTIPKSVVWILAVSFFSCERFFRMHGMSRGLAVGELQLKLLEYINE